MIAGGGILEAVQMSDGTYRFKYVTPMGAEHLGPRAYKTAAGAQRAGEKWREHETAE